MENTILCARPSNQEMDNLSNQDMIRLNKAALPYVAQIFPENVRQETRFLYYISDYCVVPLDIPEITCKMCHEVLTRGIKKGNNLAREKKCPEGAIVTDKNVVLGAGYTTYQQHHGGTHDKEASKQQGKHTTRWIGKDLENARKEITTFNMI